MRQTESDAPDVAPRRAAPEPEEETEPVFLSQTVRRMNRRRTRVLAVLSLLAAIVALVVIVDAVVQPGAPSTIEQATGEAWKATGALSDGLRELEPGDDLQPLRGRARAARTAVQRAGKRIKRATLPIGQTPVRSRVIRALRADDGWLDAVGSTLANPRSARRGDLARLAERAAIATSLIEDDVDGAKGSVGGTGRLLAATKPG